MRAKKIIRQNMDVIVPAPECVELFEKGDKIFLGMSDVRHHKKNVLKST